MPIAVRSAVAFGLVTMLGGFVAGPGVRAQPQRSAFRAGVDLVSLSVTATDSDLRYVPDLNREDFVVTENGMPQQLTFFRRRPSRSPWRCCSTPAQAWSRTWRLLKKPRSVSRDTLDRPIWPRS